MNLDRPLRISAFAILLAAGVALPSGPLARSADTARETQAALAGSRPFVLTVLGPNGKALPRVPVEFRCERAITAMQVQEGRFLRAEAGGVIVQASEKGRMVLELPKGAIRLDVLIETAGYAPYLAQWDSAFRSDVIPAAFTARLEAGWSVGGIVDDGEGRPVAGVHVTPRIPYQRPPGDYRGSYFAHFAVTDVAGRWHFDSVPASMQQVVLELDHSELMPRNCLATRTEFGLEPGRDPLARTFVKKGLVVSGKVTDETGKPIAGALVRTWYRNAHRQAVTAADGVYHLRGCGQWTVRLAASAPGRAMEAMDRSLTGKPVDFQLKPGRRIHIRARDERGSPVPGFYLLFQKWRGSVPYFEFNSVNKTADEHGIWEWHEAPLDVVEADVCRLGSLSTSVELLASRKEEYDVVIPSPTEVFGSVVDKESREPIRKFRLLVCRRSHEKSIFWFSRAWSEMEGGHYRTLVGGVRDMTQGIRIEADGYEPGESRDIKPSEGKVAIDFELRRGTNVEGVVLTPEGHPAVKARVALLTRLSRVTLTNGAIDPRLTGADWRETDSAGRFHFPPQNSRFAFVVTHASGYALYRPTPQSNRRLINLDPWTRVEGTYRVGEKALAHIPVTLSYSEPVSTRFGVPRLETSDRATTDQNGRFEFPRVMAGSGFVHRAIGWAAQGDSADIPSADSTQDTFPIGKTVCLDLRDQSCRVIGKLRLPAGFDRPVPWQRAVVEVELDRKDDREANPRFPAVVAADGTFRADGVIPGEYLLDVHFPETGIGHLWEHSFVVPTNRGNTVLELVDLGVMTLEKE